MNYRLETGGGAPSGRPPLAAVASLRPLLKDEVAKLVIAFTALLTTTAATLVSPVIVSATIDGAVKRGDYAGVALNSAVLAAIYLAAFYSSYTQVRVMGGIGRRLLFNLRAALFEKLLALPVAFFNQNKSGDLISRINSDTDRINQFVAQALMQFFSNSFLILGAGTLVLAFNWRLGLIALAPALVVVALTRVLSAPVRRANLASLQSLGGLSGEIQESLANFRVVVAFDRLDYFRRKFEAANAANYRASVRAGLANGIFLPTYGLAYTAAQLLVLVFGIAMIVDGRLTAGGLIGFLLYVNSFYNPMRQLASIWSGFQLALAALDRVNEVLGLENDMADAVPEPADADAPLLEFDHVHFTYAGDREVLSDISFRLDRGRSYAFVGPTGGGKTTTASLMARLYDPTSGTVRFEGRNLAAVPASERAQKIGFILQEPILFTGSLRDNILYGNTGLADLDNADLAGLIGERGLGDILARFDAGLETAVSASGEGLSLGQRQLVAFIRAVLRAPQLLILDEATANIDTVTEQLLEEILASLPATTTRVIIAHRLNTIANADEIHFVNAGSVIPAGSMHQAIDLLMHQTRQG